MLRDRRIVLIDRERIRLESVGMRVAVRLARQIRVAIASSMRGDGRFGRAVREITRARLKEELTAGMVAAHLQGRRRTALSAAPHFRVKSKFKLAATAYDSAIEFLTRRMNLDDDEVRRIRDMYSAQAQKVILGMDSVMNKRIQERFVDVSREGLHVRGGMKSLEPVFDAVGIGANREWLIETIYRTQTQIAYSAGRWNGLADPVVQEILWGYEYATVGDDRVRPEHVVLDGMKLPKDDSRWQSLWPPNGWNCRCTTLEIFDEGETREPVAEMVDGQMVQPGKVDRGWDFNPGTVFRDPVALSGRA